MPYLHEELVRERIRTMHREAAEHRLAWRLTLVRRARRRAQRAGARLEEALIRLA